MGNHTSAQVGRPVLVILKDRTRFRDKILGSRSRYYEFETRGRVLRSEVKALLIGGFTSRQNIKENR